MRQFAVVTGASSGIGKELARQFAQKGFDVMITSEDDGIAVAGRELAELGVQVDSVQADLTKPEGFEKLTSRIQAADRPLDAIAINAGVGVAGPFSETDLEAELSLVDLNVVSTLKLAKFAVQQMVAQKSGRILFTSSIAATMPTPYQAVYGASKAFVRYLAQGIREELKETGVSVTALMPGVTDTNFFARAGAEDTALGAGKKDDPAEVAGQAIKALMEGEDHIVAGATTNKLQAAAGHVLPDPVMAEQLAKSSKPGSAK